MSLRRQCARCGEWRGRASFLAEGGVSDLCEDCRSVDVSEDTGEGRYPGDQHQVAFPDEASDRSAESTVCGTE